MRASPPASPTEIGLVYFAGIVQGLALVTFPAASSVFTCPDWFGFDSTRLWAGPYAYSRVAYTSSA